MIIDTRYRDVPIEEASACSTPPLRINQEQWEALRGKPVRLITPPVPIRTLTCGGPFYQQADEPCRFLCVHVVEIGD